MSVQRTIAIVGAGFSGTLVATNLLQSQPVGTRIVLIERDNCMARGKAYANRDHAYLLNVPAGRMSADPGRPLDFLEFARLSLPAATADDFLPRALYGSYLEKTLWEAQANAAPNIQFDRICGAVCKATPAEGGTRIDLTLDDGRTINADDVVLALGNPAPAPLPGTEGLGDRYVSDPWLAPVGFRAGEKVLLIGTGLTMVDMVTAAAAHTGEQVVIHSISRRGLIPPSQTAFSRVPCPADSAAILRAASFSALTLLRSVRELAAETERRGGDWRETVTLVRNIAPALWQRLPLRERRRMLRHVRPYWDTHRHRVPSENLDRLHRLRQTQKLHVHAGRLAEFARVGDQVLVKWKARKTGELQSVLVDRVVNCTGPDYNVQRSTDPLVQSLMSQGLVTSDALNLGLCTGANCAVLDHQGRAANNLFYVGPMLRADHWEATAAQELRGFALQLAAFLAAAGRPIGAARTA